MTEIIIFILACLAVATGLVLVTYWSDPRPLAHSLGRCDRSV